MGLVRTPPEQRDQAAIDAGIAQCEKLLTILDAALAESPWLSGDEFGVGDIAVAPFIYNLLETVKTWQPHPNLQRWYQQLSRRPAFQNVVMIPVT
jgi:glutathione S-transferase